jgi:hypothetical protein
MRAAFGGQLVPQRPGLIGEGAQAGPEPEQLVDLPHERPGTLGVGQREVDAGQLDPGLDGDVRQRVGQVGAAALGTDQFPAGRRELPPVRGRPGVHRPGRSPVPARRAMARSGN